MEKTTIQKNSYEKITTTALLFFVALFTLTTCLTAQESGQPKQDKQDNKQESKGWFVGVSPFSFIGS